MSRNDRLYRISSRVNLTRNRGSHASRRRMASSFVIPPPFPRLRTTKSASESRFTSWGAYVGCGGENLECDSDVGDSAPGDCADDAIAFTTISNTS